MWIVFKYYLMNIRFDYKKQRNTSFWEKIVHYFWVYFSSPKLWYNFEEIFQVMFTVSLWGNHAIEALLVDHIYDDCYHCYHTFWCNVLSIVGHIFPIFAAKSWLYVTLMAVTYGPDCRQTISYAIFLAFNLSAYV